MSKLSVAASFKIAMKYVNAISEVSVVSNELSAIVDALPRNSVATISNVLTTKNLNLHTQTISLINILIKNNRITILPVITKILQRKCEIGTTIINTSFDISSADIGGHVTIRKNNNDYGVFIKKSQFSIDMRLPSRLERLKQSLIDGIPSFVANNTLQTKSIVINSKPSE